MEFRITRRRFNQLAMASTTLAFLKHFPEKATAEPSAGGPATPNFAEAMNPIEVSLTVNKQKHTLKVDPRTTLLDLLRERLELTGSKKGCDQGQCGACTVLANGKRIYSCLALAVMHQDNEITTIEGLASGETLHPMQAAFIEHDGFQCGYCTPGQIMSAVGMLAEPCGASNGAVRECMSGNLCRCGAYANIVAAIQDVRGGKS